MEKSKSTPGIGILGFIFLIFLALKLTEIGQVKNWSWWWVTSPIWIPAALVIIGFVVYVILKMGFNNFQQKEEEIPMRSKFQERLEKMAKERLAKQNQN